jgi:hypothetical protein
VAPTQKDQPPPAVGEETPITKHMKIPGTNRNLVMCPDGAKTEKRFAGVGQQQFTGSDWYE